MIDRNASVWVKTLQHRLRKVEWSYIQSIFGTNKVYSMCKSKEFKEISNSLKEITDGFVPTNIASPKKHYDYISGVLDGSVDVYRYYAPCLACNRTFKKPKKFSTLCTRCKDRNIKVCQKHCYVHGFLSDFSDCLACVVEKSHVKFDGTVDIDYVECTICGLRARELTSHYYNTHKLHKSTLSDTNLVCDSKRENIEGEKNPAYNHGGKFSPFSRNFIKYDSLEHYRSSLNTLTQKCNRTKIENSSNNTKIEFYIKSGMEYEDALEALTNRQATNSNFSYFDDSLISGSKEGIFYVIILHRDGEKYIKIGISRNQLSERYSNYILSNHEIHSIYKSTIKSCYLLEKELKGICTPISREDRFMHFGWSEVFEYDETILQKIADHAENYGLRIEEFHDMNKGS